MKIIDKVFGTHSERELKRIYPLADKVDSLGPAMAALSDEELRGKTKEYKERLVNGEYGKCLDCGEDISEARLRVRPHALFCIQCKSRHEKMMQDL